MNIFGQIYEINSLTYDKAYEPFLNAEIRISDKNNGDVADPRVISESTEMIVIPSENALWVEMKVTTKTRSEMEPDVVLGSYVIFLAKVAELAEQNTDKS